MPPSKSDRSGHQAAFDFLAVEATPPPATAQVVPVASRFHPEPPTVVRINDRRRSRHLAVVRKLLAETGVFKTS